MPRSFTDEIIDAILQNENRHAGRPRRGQAEPLSAAGRDRLIPEWSHVPRRADPPAVADRAGS